MKHPKLLRRYSFILPTLPLTAVILIVLGLSIYVGFSNVASYLALSEPIDAEYLVIEGWVGKKELRQAYRVFEEGNYKLTVVSGGPILDDFNSGPPNYADRARNYLLSIGFPKNKLFAVPAPASAQERTFLSAVMVRDWFSGQDIDISSIDVFSESVHSRRSRYLYQLAFGETVDIGVYASDPDGFELNRWWQSSYAARSVISELTGWVMVICCYEFGMRGSQLEKWGAGELLSKK
jgi:hypothetical protein